MPGAKIEFTNIKEVLAGIEARKKKLLDVPKAARQMGVLALNEIHPITHKKSGNWDNSIHANVTQLSEFKWELWVGSDGAFSANGFNYGRRQENLNHPIEIGWFKAWPRMVDQFNQVVHGVASRTVNDSVDEFASMAGF